LSRIFIENIDATEKIEYYAYSLEIFDKNLHSPAEEFTPPLYQDLYQINLCCCFLEHIGKGLNICCFSKKLVYLRDFFQDYLEQKKHIQDLTFFL